MICAKRAIPQIRDKDKGVSNILCILLRLKCVVDVGTWGHK